MVISSLTACAVNASGSVTSQQTMDPNILWRQTPQTNTEAEQQNCVMFNNHEPRTSTSPLQNGEDYSSENGTENLSPPRETSRSSSSEDMLTSDLFPISGTSMMQMDYSNSDNESSQASPPSFHDEEEFHSTKGAANGKPKVHKCKNCNYTTTSKHEIWTHIAIHMKPEKILRCTKCPFVTEYKHHMDFHVTNHEGVKPYKCEKCQYMCVNKSMLKSHLKSHSNVYQFRCGDCAYKTKYHHSMKIHLRKYTHQQGLILEPDGSVSQNQIIDVYGNRRGPKHKSKKSEHSQPQQPIPTLNTFQNFPWVNSMFFNDNSRIPCSPLLSSSAIMTPPYLVEGTKPEKEDKNVLGLHLNAINNNNIFNNNNNDRMVNMQLSNMKIDHNQIMDSAYEQPMVETYLEDRHSPISPHIQPPNQTNFMPYERLISSPEGPDSLEDLPLNLTISQCSNRVSDSSSAAPSKSRRKGVACKLKRVYTNSEDEESIPVEVKIETKDPEVEDSQQKDKEHRNDPIAANELVLTKLKNNKNFFYCSFCEITFFNQIMFTMHMGYHGYSDPFTCNRCGKKNEDNIQFYAHMISEAHV